MTETREIRCFRTRELRVVDGAKGPRIEGYAALFNTRSEDLGGFVEVIAPGAFADAIDRSDIRALFNHDPSFVLGRVKSGTLKVSEDRTGLWIENTPPDTQWARDLVTSMRRGDIDQMSFGFTVGKDGARWTPEGNVMIRTVDKIQELFDVSPVTYPAYADTSVAVRSLQDWRKDRSDDWREELERYTRRHHEAMAR